jgi:ectoine hydroxylase-related dioxygenase (phytanoyl-CoA dioxygenase family)
VQLGSVTRQIMYPARYHELFRSNKALETGRAIARELLGCAEPATWFDMLIYKPPGHPASTPWHQDMAYGGQPMMPPGKQIPTQTEVQFWMALDDVDETNGCMHFIPGAHTKTLLPHYVAGGDPSQTNRLLAITEPETHLDFNTIVACPLPAGGATVHNYGTPHYTPPNRSADRHRRAYIFSFSNPERAHTFS